MSHAQRTAQSHARWTTTHQYTPKHPRKLENTKGENKWTGLRGFLEEMQRTDPTVQFRSQDQGDFTLDATFVLECDGPHHEKQSRKDNDAWKNQQLWELGYYILRFKEEWILHSGGRVKRILEEFHGIIQDEAKRKHRKEAA